VRYDGFAIERFRLHHIANSAPIVVPMQQLGGESFSPPSSGFSQTAHEVGMETYQWHNQHAIFEGPAR